MRMSNLQNEEINNFKDKSRELSQKPQSNK